MCHLQSIGSSSATQNCFVGQITVEAVEETEGETKSKAARLNELQGLESEEADS